MVANLLRPTVDVAHRDDDAEHGGDDAEPGQRIAGRANQGDRLVLLLVEGFHLGIEEQRQIAHAAAVHQLLQAVDQEPERVMILEHRGVHLEDGALLGILDVRFHRQGALAAHHLEEMEQQLEQLEIVALGWRVPRESLLERRQDSATDATRGRDHQRSHRRPADDHQLVRLEQHGEGPSSHREASENGSEDDDEPDDGGHAC